MDNLNPQLGKKAKMLNRGNVEFHEIVKVTPKRFTLSNGDVIVTKTGSILGASEFCRRHIVEVEA
jgi:hypothetical protein